MTCDVIGLLPLCAYEEFDLSILYASNNPLLPTYRAEGLNHVDEESFRTIAMELWGAHFSPVSRLPDINNIQTSYKIMSTVTVNVFHSTGGKSNEYEVAIQEAGKIGLHLVCVPAVKR